VPQIYFKIVHSYSWFFNYCRYAFRPFKCIFANTFYLQFVLSISL